ncbi:RagB/SusD family nutrient uptake outer membrane protein [Pedobacter jejuensis]|uniref:RagB/SusD family nutrient uptake outer membrane protein n=1 Tax=Pedobacter jejuensis TaxID=1268550 RepID=A0A3N0BST1_9SPHI|nr:RagB/SusD family nutrient uptake outer membrane protein [Pedobacter jejuensis]RNL52106.1 RagB/SusD family nutrient uptake outer membrane protein [Pedobacter jejuensis]
MKKLIILFNILAYLMVLESCSKLDVDVESQYVKDNFPVTNSDYAALFGTMYSNLSSQYGVPYWRMQELSGDAAIIPARDGNFDDGGQYRQLHYHTWTIDHPNVRDIWQWGFGGINNCNRLINLTNESNVAAATKASSLAEVKAMRALYYFFMMDLYGNVPIIDTFPVSTLPGNQTRDKVFEFIEKELLSIVAQLPVKDNNNRIAVYGRPTQAMAYALLEKMYLNAEVYTGKPRYADAVIMADNILKNTNYALDNKYSDIFDVNNGPQINETIFAVPYDQQIPGNQMTRFGFYPALAPAYGINVGFSIAMSTTPEYYNRFNLANDIRNSFWLIGKQYAPDANRKPDLTKPVFVAGTTTQIEITPDLILKPGKPMDLGNTVADQAKGVRSVKYWPDVNAIQATRLNGNDMPLLRLADVMLMKAEAILRGAAATTVNGELQTPMVLVNKIRNRAGAPTVATVTLSSLLDERAREFSWEAWRRNDLIRFGQFETEYPLPNDVLFMNKDLTRRIYPIPANELKLNTNLRQNPGY